VIVILVSTFARTFCFYMCVLFFMSLLLNLCLFEKHLIMWNVVKDDKSPSERSNLEKF